MHSLIFVLVPHYTPDIPAEVERLMEGSKAAPDKLFPAYRRECYCVGHEANKEAFEQVDNSPQGIIWNDNLKQARKAQNDWAAQKIVEERAAEVYRVERLHPGYNQPDAECDTCHGSGYWVDTRDPADVYDWWSIGGRWDFRDLDSDDADEEEDEATDEEYLARNCFSVRRLLAEPMYPCAIISPDGLLYQEDLDVSFALHRSEEVLQKEQEWHQIVQKIWADNPDYLAVVVDGHS